MDDNQNVTAPALGTPSEATQPAAPSEPAGGDIPETLFGMKVLFDKKVGLQPAKLRAGKPKKRKNGRTERS
jgi:hypothetical protein